LQIFEPILLGQTDQWHARLPAQRAVAVANDRLGSGALQHGNK